MLGQGRAGLLLKRVARLAERALAVAGALLLVYHAFFEVGRVTLTCMEPLLRASGEADWVLLERVTARRAPSRFQVVSYLDEDSGMAVLKRVAAFPGETIEVTEEHVLLIDGRVVPTPEGVGNGIGYVRSGNLASGPFLVPRGQLYVLGDNSPDAYDSRWAGTLAVEKVRGRALLRIWPLSRVGWLL